MVVAVMLPLRQWSYSIYLRVHQAMAVTIVGALWVHIRGSAKFTRIYVWTLSGTFGATTMIVVALAYHRRCFDRRTPWFYEEMLGDTKVVRIALPLHQQVSAGQYLTVHLLRCWPWQVNSPYRLAFYQPGGTKLRRWRRETLEGQDPKRRSSVAKAEVEIWVAGRPRWLEASKAPFQLQSRWLLCGPYGMALPNPTVPNVILVASGNRIGPLLWLSHAILGQHQELRTRVRDLRIHWFLNDWSKISTPPVAT